MEKPSPETTRGLIKCERLEAHSSREEHTNQDESDFQFGFFLVTKNGSLVWSAGIPRKEATTSPHGTCSVASNLYSIFLSEVLKDSILTSVDSGFILCWNVIFKIAP